MNVTHVIMIMDPIFFYSAVFYEIFYSLGGGSGA